MLVKTSKRSADRANRRRDKRRTLPQLTVRFDGKTYTTLDWSMGGFAIKGYGGRRREEDEFPVELSAEVSGRELSALMIATAVRRDRKTGLFAAYFSRFYDDAFGILEQIATRRIRR